jgi:hypothetical protein
MKKSARISQTSAASKRLTLKLLAIPVRLLAALKNQQVSKAAARENIRIAMMTNAKKKGKT